ncbi:centrosomal protein of 83 kDa isoform X1 [Syngnathus scovelli]|uniref:centrosomal protein of 83 kDa isoform X1 n=1 Tax=Syngnathus scovelli TaxID=161590 RepID=UPI00210FFE14|nr:trichohyalin isoform X1 [Syngnathus scovelli]
MNWDRQVSSILSAADDSVANMRGRLSSLGNTSKREESFQFKEKFHDSDFDTLAVSAPSSSAQQVRPVNPGVQWADIASIQSQLQTQNQVIMESLTKKLRDIEQEKQSQQFHMQTLQAEVDRLRQDLRGRRREKDFGGQEQVMSDVGTSAFPKDSWSSKTCRAELEHLRKEVEQLKTRLRRQEEAMMLQEKEAREHRRQCQHSSEQMLQELTDRYKSHSTDLAKRSFEYVQKEVHHISNTVSELEGEVIRLRERQITLTAKQKKNLYWPDDSPRVKVEEAKQDSDSDDFSPTASLAEISSDLSLLDDLALERQSIPSGVKNDFLDEEEYDDRDILDDDDDVNPEFGSDLSLTDF